MDALALDKLPGSGSRTSSIATTKFLSSPTLPLLDIPIKDLFPDGLNVNNWRRLLPSLPDDIRDDIEYNEPPKGTNAQPTWTVYASESKSERQIRIPLHIEGIPVIIPVPPTYTLVAGGCPPPDPYEKLIDPSSTLDSEIADIIFKLYDFSIGFYLLLDGNLQILVPSGFDSTCEFLFKCSNFSVRDSRIMLSNN